jgi:apolipoprotein N-acyltransferase
MVARHAAATPTDTSLHVSARGRCLAAAAAGVAGWAAFPPLDLWPLGILSVTVLTLAVRGAGRRVAALAGWLFGLGLFVPMLSFLRGLGVDAWLVLAVAMAVWFALHALGSRVLVRLPGWPLLVGCLWVAEEWARSRVPFGGFPWGRLAFGQADGPLLPLAAVGGAVGIAFVVAPAGAAFAWVAVTLPRRPPVGLAGVAAGVAAVVVALVATPVPTAGTADGGPAHAVVAAVQGNVPRLGLDEFAQRRAVTANHAAQTRALAAQVAAGKLPRPDVVVWPENASDADPFHDEVARSLIEGAVQAVGVPVVVGAVLDGPDAEHVQNAAIVWSPTDGPGMRYVKRHLVPFGEYLPLRSVLGRLIDRFSLIPRDFAPGDRPGVLTAGPVTLADVICFEVADDGVVRDAVSGGGRILVVQTNNATYERVGDDGHGGETAQQLEMSRLRAVEHGRAVVVAATSGVSALIAPDGRVLQRSGVFTPSLLVADLPLRDPVTVADRLGAWPERVLTAVALLALLATLRRRRRGADEAVDHPAPVLAGSR